MEFIMQMARSPKTRAVVFLAALVVLVWLLHEPARAPTYSEEKERLLASLPVGLKIIHAPDPAKAQPNNRKSVPLKYMYNYKTTVQSTIGPLTVEEFGAFVWQSNHWVFSTYTGTPFTTQNFADWYSCPGAVLQSGQSYADPENWSAADVPRDGFAKWYYIAVDAKGNRFKGEGIIHELAQTDP